MKDKLDKVLRDWASRGAAEQERLDRLATDICGALRREGPSRATEAPLPQRSRSVWGKLAYAGMGAIAALVVAAVLWSALAIDTERHNGNGVGATVMLSAPEVRTNARLFQETELLFPTSLQWVTNTDREFQVGLASPGQVADVSARPVLVRVVIVARRTGGSAWRKVWGVDVVVRAEELIEVTPDSASGNRIALWAYPLADGMIAVDSKLTFRTPVSATCTTSDVLTPGRPSQVLSLKANGAEYRVFQMVVLLPHKGC